MKKIAFAVMTAALLGACSSRNDEGAADSAAAGAAVGSPAVTDTGMGGMTDTTMGGTTGTAGTTGAGDTTRRDSATTPPPR